MPDLIKFYLNAGRDSEGRTLTEIWAMGDDELMHMHDAIQWLFPVAEPSNFNANAPILTEEQIAEFNSNPQLNQNLLKSFHRFMQVFGLECDGNEIVECSDVGIWDSLNHNWLRFTRILRSLTMLGLPAEAFTFCFLERKIGNVPSMTYWQEAVGLATIR